MYSLEFKFDVVVVGAGHAGVEAAMAAAVDAAKASATKDSTVTITLPTIAIGTTL